VAEKQRGLASIREAREDRQRGKYSRATPNMWLFVLLALVATLVVYRLIAGHTLDRDKHALLAKQRAVAATLGKEWFPLRDQLEKATLEAAATFQGDFVDSETARWDFRSLPGIYLRLRVAEAKDAASLRRAAAGSTKDSFAACLLREPNQAAARGEADASAFAEQPWNLRQAYAATRVLSDEWNDEVKEAGDDLRLRVFQQQYDKAIREEIPLAVEIIKRAQFFLLVLDEDPEDARALADGGPVTEEQIQLVGHPARVHVVNLKNGNTLFRLRRSGEASFMFAGERAVTDLETRAAMQRQVNNCALAQQVQAAIATDAGR
jgi:hypothetical protein